MFAVALWDTKRRRLVLARDRLGVKPLHYVWRRQRIYFASEIKSLLQAPLSREIDFDSLSRFFTFEYVPAPRSIFKGIRKILPGHRLVFRGRAGGGVLLLGRPARRP